MFRRKENTDLRDLAEYVRRIGWSLGLYQSYPNDTGILPELIAKVDALADALDLEFVPASAKPATYVKKGKKCT